MIKTNLTFIVKFITLAVLLLPAVILPAQTIQSFTLTNVTNGQTLSLESYPSCSGVVIIFTSNSCPYDEHYRGRITSLARSFQDKVPLLLVNSTPDESPEAMAKMARQLGLTLPYLADKEQKLMQQLGATKTPHAFLLKNNGGKYTVVYHGAIDDNAQVESDVRHAYLRDAIEIMLNNQKVATAEVRPMGCTLRKK